MRAIVKIAVTPETIMDQRVIKMIRNLELGINQKIGSRFSRDVRASMVSRLVEVGFGTNFGHNSSEPAFECVQ